MAKAIESFRHLLKNVIATQQGLLSKNPKSSEEWRLGDRFAILDRPDHLCPYCHKGFRGRTTYLVDTFNNKVAFAIENGEPKSTSHCHPHVTGYGSICMGNASDAISALTVGLNPSSAYFEVGNWVVEQGHVCDENPNRPMKYCYVCWRFQGLHEMVEIFNYNFLCRTCVSDHLKECSHCHQFDFAENMVRRTHDSDTIVEPWVWFHRTCIPEGLEVCEGCDTLFDTLTNSICRSCEGGGE